MKHCKLLWLLMALVLFWGCSDNQQTETTVDKSSVESDAQAEIRAMINEYFERVTEGDKTVLYENEFTYYTDGISLGEYMEFRQVLDYKYDTLSGVIVDSIEVMGDSARLRVRIVYIGAEGDEKERPYVLKAYRTGDRWVRPYLSHWKDEAEYLELIRIYDSAAAAESEE